MSHTALQYPQVAQSGGRKGPHMALLGSERNLVCSLPCFSWGLSTCTVGDSTQSSAPQGTVSRSIGWHDLAQRGGSMGTQPQGTSPFLAPVAGRDAGSKAPVSCLAGLARQLSRSRVNSALPATTGGCSKKPSRTATPTSLFILDGRHQGSEFVFTSFPLNAEKSQHRDKPHQNEMVFSKPLALSPPE